MLVIRNKVYSDEEDFSDKFRDAITEFSPKARIIYNLSDSIDRLEEEKEEEERAKNKRKK